MSKRGSKQGQYTGAKRRFAGGKLIQEADYVGGNLHGNRRIWSPSGVLLAESEYSDGKLNGKSRVWYEDGTLSIVSEYVNHELHGAYESYWPDGKIKESGTYIHGQRTKYRWFDNEGNLIQTVNSRL